MNIEELSLPTRGAWIETCSSVNPIIGFLSLPTRGAWIETAHFGYIHERIACRSPHGGRGLKLFRALLMVSIMASLPTRGAWIETCTRQCA